MDQSFVGVETSHHRDAIPIFPTLAQYALERECGNQSRERTAFMNFLRELDIFSSLAGGCEVLTGAESCGPRVLYFDVAVPIIFA